MLTTFSTSVHRLNIALDLAMKHRRKVAVVGRSMLNVIAHARNLGYIKCPNDLFVPLKAIHSLPEEQTLILCTGSQGEKFAAITRISKGEHRHVKIRQGDTIIFSANPIPGNTIPVVNTIDRIMTQGANVIYGKQLGLHVSGHGSQEDQKLMLALTKPKFFVPVHGEYRMLVKHSETAKSVGIPPENIVIINNGDTIKLTPNSISKGDKVPSGIELVDTAGIVHDNVMQERERLAEDGVITVSATVDPQGQLLAKPEIHLRGVVCTMEMTALDRLITRTVNNLVSDRLKSKLLFEGDDHINWTAIRNEVETTLEFVVQKEINSDPLVIFMLHVQETSIVSSTNGNGNGNGKYNHMEGESKDEDLDPRFNRRRRSKVDV